MAKPSITQNLSAAYVYEILVDGVVRYIGKGTGNRSKRHMYIVARLNRSREAGQTVRALKFHNRLAKAVRGGAKVDVLVVGSGMSHEDALTAEIAAIAATPEGQLWNETPGGEGMHPDFAKKLWADPVYREKRSETHAREEFREKQRQNSIRQFASAEARDAMRERSRKMWQDDDYRVRGEAALRAVWDSDETRARHKEAVRKFRAENPEKAAAGTTAVLAYNQRQDVREKRSGFFKAAWKDPEFKAKATAHWNDPERKKAILAKVLTPEFLALRGKAISEGLRRKKANGG